VRFVVGDARGVTVVVGALCGAKCATCGRLFRGATSGKEVSPPPPVSVVIDTLFSAVSQIFSFDVFWLCRFAISVHFLGADVPRRAPQGPEFVFFVTFCVQ